MNLGACQGWAFSHKLEIKMPKKVSWIDRLPLCCESNKLRGTLLDLCTFTRLKASLHGASSSRFCTFWHHCWCQPLILVLVLERVPCISNRSCWSVYHSAISATHGGARLCSVIKLVNSSLFCTAIAPVTELLWNPWVQLYSLEWRLQCG